MAAALSRTVSNTDSGINPRMHRVLGRRIEPSAVGSTGPFKLGSTSNSDVLLKAKAHDESGCTKMCKLGIRYGVLAEIPRPQEDEATYMDGRHCRGLFHTPIGLSENSPRTGLSRSGLSRSGSLGSGFFSVILRLSFTHASSARAS
jgi:hypothetical protein